MKTKYYKTDVLGSDKISVVVKPENKAIQPSLVTRFKMPDKLSLKLGTLKARFFVRSGHICSPARAFIALGTLPPAFTKLSLRSFSRGLPVGLPSSTYVVHAFKASLMFIATD
jgi:hypothetical protein